MKKFAMYFGFVVLGLYGLACKDKGDIYIDDPIGKIQVMVSVNIKIRNKLGIDMLDPNLPNSLRTFKVFYPVDSTQGFHKPPTLERGAGICD